MPTLLCLNELSCTHEVPVGHIDSAMRRFVSTLRAIGAGAILVTPVRLPNIELGPGYPMGRWAADGRNRDYWRAIRALQSRAPFTFEELADDAGPDYEYWFGNQHARGLGVAHSHDGLAVSLDTHEQWSPSALRVERIWTDEDAEDLGNDHVTVRHAARPEHIVEHTDWLRTAATEASINSGNDLWENRFELFPALEFLDRVRSQLLDLPHGWIRPVYGRLRTLQSAAAEWNPAEGNPRWRSKVTPEHEQRRLRCWFVDFDGERRLFDVHARFTPGDGRIHLRLVPESRTLRIAHVGGKIPD